MARTYSIDGSLLYIGQGVSDFNKIPSAADFSGESWQAIGGLTEIPDLPVNQESRETRLISERVTSYSKGPISFGEAVFQFTTDLDDDGQKALMAAQKSCKTFAFRIESGGDCGEEAEVTISVDDPAVVTWAAHGLSDGTPVRFTTNGQLPDPISEEKIYYIVNSSSGTFEISESPGGAAIETTQAGSGDHTAIAMPAGLSLMFFGQVKWGGYGVGESYLKQVPIQVASTIAEA